GAGDTYGGLATEPRHAPDRHVHDILVGPARTALSYNLEGPQGWVVGAPGDDAETGIWIQAAPEGTRRGNVQVQPAEDHTPPPGFMCFVTGNAAPNSDPGTNDVDNGHTTLTTPIIDAVADGHVHPVFEYYRWYSNDQGTNTDDYWTVDISNDA